MKVKVPLMIVIVLAATVGYLLGTEAGRQRKELVLVRLGRSGGQDADPVVENGADA